MFGFGRKRKVVVKQYHSPREMEHDANKMLERGYDESSVQVSKTLGLPTLSHGMLHDQFTVTYRCGRC